MATCREKLRLEYPTAIGDDPSDRVFRGGCRGCPDDYGYLDPPRFCNDPRLDPTEKCTKCWDREIPEKEKENETMSNTNNLNIQPDYEAQCKALTDRCCSLERNVKALEIENKALETYIENLEARLVKHEIVVKCVEALTGASLGIE